MTDAEQPTIEPASETTLTPIPTAPVAADAAPPPVPTAAAPRRSRRARWAVAALVVALVVGASAAVTLALTGSSPNASILGYVPGDSLAYAEVRLDLPGDQRQQVAAFLSKFPGFADQAALDTKIGETLDQLVGKGSDGKQSYTKDIAPWFGGELGYAMGPLSAPAQASTSAVLTATDPAALAADSRFVALLSVKDAAVAQAWFDQLVASSGEKTTTQTYGSTKLTVYADSETKVDLAFGIVDGKVALLGDLTSVKAAIDTKGAGPLASDPAFRAAQAANVGDQVGFFFVRLKALLDQAKAMSPSLGAEAAGVSDTLTSLVPEWASGRLRIESDALVIDGSTPHVDGAPGPTTNHVNAVADHAPPTTIALAAGNDVGATVTSWVDLLRKDPKLSEAFQQIDQAVAMAGGWDGVLGWMGDTGVVISATGDGVEGGVISVPTDAAKAQRFFTTVRSAILLGGGQLGFKVTDETYAGATITVVDLGPIKDLAAQAAGPDAGSMSVLGGSLPAGNATIAYAVTDTVVVIGSSPDFVKHALDAGTGDSLADTARYHDLLARVGASGTGVTYLDISAARAAAERHLAEMPAADKAEYEESVKPFLTPFDAFIASGVTGPELVQQHSLITVK